MSWYHARKAVRERIARNRQRYKEAPMHAELERGAFVEQEPVRELTPEFLHVFDKENFFAKEVEGQRRWLLLPQFVCAVRRQKTHVGPDMYCRACGQEISEGELRIYFQFRWFKTDERVQTGAVHHLMSACGRQNDSDNI